MAILLDDERVRFWNGYAYRFKRVDKGQWVCTNSDLVPGDIREEIEKEWD